MKRFTTFFAVCGAFAISLILFGCPDKSDDPAPFDEELLPGSWQLTASTVAISGLPESNVFNDLEACVKDDSTIFVSDGNYRELEGLTKCDPSDPSVIEEGTWKIKGNQLITKHGSDEETFQITTLSSSTFKISFEFQAQGKGAKATSTFTKRH
jgi:hypothetical protein